MDAESVDVTAGLGGFLAFFLLAVALYFLMRNMNARMRRMAYREEQEAKAAEQARGATGEGAGDVSPAEPFDGPDSLAAADDDDDAAADDDDSGPGGSDSSGPHGGPIGGPDTR